VYGSDAFDGVGEAALKGIGTGARIRLSTDRLGFGRASVGTSGKSQPLVIKNTGNRPMTITGVNSTSGSFLVDSTACSAPLLPSESCTMLVTMQPITTGNVSGTLTVLSDAVVGVSSLILAGTGL
jgi:hypothetical protein